MRAFLEEETKKSQLKESESGFTENSRVFSQISTQIPPEPPKKALCPFFLYRMDVYDEIKAEHPNLRITEITRIIGEMWKIVDPKLKERYEQ